jgi:hypothetical protein
MVSDSTKIKTKINMGRVIASVFFKFVLPLTLFAGAFLYVAWQAGVTTNP